ncbi:MAG: restriction endonuclease [Actinomycetota bacterium]|nr:restriction endonuclease [Actinomycetota bacterium]
MSRGTVEVVVPTHDSMMWPMVLSVAQLGGSGSISEISDAVIKRQRYSDEQLAVLHTNGTQTKIDYRLAWARSHLKLTGFLINSSRGVWSLTEAGDELVQMGEPEGPQRLQAEWKAATRTARRQSSGSAQQQLGGGGSAKTGEIGSDIDEEYDWKSDLLEALMTMEPAAFERLAQRLLREADFISVNVTGRSGDGGIDGLGIYRLSLLSFPVFFQCKRYRGSVGSGAVRDFRGAMAGRGDKGLLITTGTFTADAKAESTRDGAPPVDLIDGLALCDLLKQYELGVRTAIRQVEDITVEPNFFAQL